MLRRGLSFILPGRIVVPEESAINGYIRPSPTYKPQQTVEFDGLGETLLYSVEAFSQTSVLFPIPWSLGTYFGTTASAWVWWTGGLGSYSLLMAIPGYISILPHIYHLHSLRRLVHKVWYVRGGLVKLETRDLTGVVSFKYSELGNISLKSVGSERVKEDRLNFPILEESGSLSADLKLSMLDWVDFNETQSDAVLTLSRKGKVHNPELFQALIQGYNLEVDDFVMNFDPENSLVSSKSIGY